MKMKAILKLLLVALFAASMLLIVSCSTSSYYVNFDADGGSAVDSVEVDHGATIGTAPVTVKEGYTFGGWYLDNDKWDFEHYAITKNMTLKAKWIKNHTVSFDSNGGTAVDSTIVVDGTKAIAPNDPIKEDSDFLGWFIGDVKWNFAENAVTEDITLTAKWHDNYTVKFNPDGSNYIPHQKIKAGETVVKPTDPIRHGFEFAGWFVSDENGVFLSDKAWDFTTPVNESFTLKAKWTPIYTVSFSTEGAGKIDSIKLPQGSLIPVPAEIKKDGYIFDGWFVGDTLWNFETTPVTSDVKLVAKWSAITYEVTLDKNTGAEDEEPTKLVVLQGDVITAPEAPTLDGYAFLGWYVFNTEDETFSDTPWNFETGVVTANLTLKARWIKTWNVSFKLDGVVTDSFTINEGSLITAPEDNPEKDGCAFIGWYNGQTPWNFTTPVTSDVTLTAVFLTKHTVKFDLDGALGDPIPDSTLLFGEKITKPTDPEKPGYVFEGWYFENTLWNFDTPISGNVTLTAKWAEMFTVEFTDNGTFISSVKVAAGHKIPAPEIPTKYLYLFSHWQTHNGTEWNLDTDVVTGNITLYAAWDINYWIITFDTNGAGTIDPVYVERGELVPEPMQPEKEGVGFEGWVYKSTGAPFDFTKAPTGDTTIKAKWTAEFFTVNFYSNNVLVKTQRVAYINPYAVEVLKSELEAIEGHEFFGWISNIKDGAWDFATDKVEGDMDLHADWRKVFKVTLTVDTDNDEVYELYEILTAFEGKPAGFCLNPTKENAVFLGWYDENGNLWDLETKIVTADITLKARWEESGTVYYDLQGGWVPDDSFLGYETVKKGEKYTEPKTPIKTKYVFGGWVIDGTDTLWNFDEDTADGEIILHALWIPKYYVSFDSNGGEGSYPQQEIVTGGAAIAPTVAPTKEYMSFDGWYLGNELYNFATPVTSDIILTAKWSRIQYTVNFNANGGEGGSEGNEFDAGKTISAPNVTRSGYVLKEWRVGSTSGRVWNFESDILTENVTLVAVWTNAKVTVRFDLNGGTAANGEAFVSSQIVNYNSLLTKFDNPYMGTPNSEYVFKGWFRPDGTKWDFDKDVATADITLTAKWETDYVVSFDPDNGENGESKRVTSGSLVLPPLVNPTKLGYTFLGWFDGDTKWDFTTMTVTEDLTLVAKWKLEIYTVSFVTRDPNTKELVTLYTQTVTYGGFVTCPEETPYIGDNYQFDSWRDTNGNVWKFNVNTITGDTVIQAYWETPGTGSEGGVNGPWDEGTATRGPIHDFS